MMKRLSLFIAVFLIFSSVVSLSAFDMGGSIASSTDFSTDITAPVSNEEALGFWIESGRGEHYSFEMKTDIIASFDNSGTGFYINPDYFKLDGIWNELEYGPSILATTIGRFKTADFSSRVFSQSIDGMIWNFNYPKVELTVAAGTTGLFLSETGSKLTTSPVTIMSKTDLLYAENNVSLFEYLQDPAAAQAAGQHLFTSPRAVEIITLTLPQIFMKQDLTFSLVAQEDLRPAIDVIKGYSDAAYVSPLIQAGQESFDAERGGAVDTQYIGAGISGPTIPGLYHNVYYYFGTGRSLTYGVPEGSATGAKEYYYETTLSHMAGLTVDMFLPWLFNSKVGGAIIFGSGDPDAQGLYEGNMAGYYTQFTPITSGGGGFVFSSGISNILSGNVNYLIKPLEWIGIPFISNLQVGIAGIPFFRVVDGPTAITGISPSFNGNYLGSEIDLSVNMRPFSDLGVIIQAGYFIPGTDVFSAGSDFAEPVFKANLNVSLSF